VLESAEYGTIFVMQKSKPLVSILIPAYNNKEYTRHTLESVLQQDYRPLKVLLIDDASPDSLESLAQWFENHKDDGIHFRYVRNESNLSADGYYLWREFIDTEWLIQLHHDDWFIDPYFISQAVAQIVENPNLVVVWANAVTEFSKIKMVRDAIEDWRILSGPDFLTYFLLNGHTAWSAIVYKWSALKVNFNFPRPPFLIDRSTKATTNLDIDEGFSSFYLLSQLGDAAVSGKVVSIRGEPKSSYSRSAQWKTVSHSLFFIYMGCYINDFDFKSSKEVRRIARLSTYLYGINSSEGFLLSSILSYYKESFFSVISMQYLLCWLFSAFNFSSYALKIGLKLRSNSRLPLEHSVLFLLFIVVFPLLLLRSIPILIRWPHIRATQPLGLYNTLVNLDEATLILYKNPLKLESDVEANRGNFALVRRKVLKELNSVLPSANVGIYGSGLHTKALLFLCPELFSYSLSFYNSAGEGIFLGEAVKSVDELERVPPEILIYSSREYEEVMYKYVRHVQTRHVTLYHEPVS